MNDEPVPQSVILKVLYTFDDSTNFLARSSSTIPCQVFTLPAQGSDDGLTIGCIKLASCLKLLSEASPELFDANSDFSIYSKDITEPSEPLVGHGLYSKISFNDQNSNASSTNQNITYVVGRICKSFMNFFNGVSKSDTLEVRLKFSKVKQPQQAQAQAQAQTQTPQQQQQHHHQQQQQQKHQQMESIQEQRLTDHTKSQPIEHRHIVSEQQNSNSGYNGSNGVSEKTIPVLFATEKSSPQMNNNAQENVLPPKQPINGNSQESNSWETRHLYQNRSTNTNTYTNNHNNVNNSGNGAVSKKTTRQRKKPAPLTRTYHDLVNNQSNDSGDIFKQPLTNRKSSIEGSQSINYKSKFPDIADEPQLAVRTQSLPFLNTRVHRIMLADKHSSNIPEPPSEDVKSRFSKFSKLLSISSNHEKSEPVQAKKNKSFIENVVKVGDKEVTTVRKGRNTILLPTNQSGNVNNNTAVPLSTSNLQENRINMKKVATNSNSNSTSMSCVNCTSTESPFRFHKSGFYENGNSGFLCNVCHDLDVSKDVKGLRERGTLGSKGLLDGPYNIKTPQEVNTANSNQVSLSRVVSSKMNGSSKYPNSTSATIASSSLSFSETVSASANINHNKSSVPMMKPMTSPSPSTFKTSTSIPKKRKNNNRSEQMTIKETFSSPVTSNSINSSSPIRSVPVLQASVPKTKRRKTNKKRGITVGTQRNNNKDLKNDNSLVNNYNIQSSSPLISNTPIYSSDPMSNASYNQHSNTHDINGRGNSRSQMTNNDIDIITAETKLSDIQEFIKSADSFLNQNKSKRDAETPNSVSLLPTDPDPLFYSNKKNQCHSIVKTSSDPIDEDETDEEEFDEEEENYSSCNDQPLSAMKLNTTLINLDDDDKENIQPQVLPLMSNMSTNLEFSSKRNDSNISNSNIRQSSQNIQNIQQNQQLPISSQELQTHRPPQFGSTIDTKEEEPLSLFGTEISPTFKRILQSISELSDAHEAQSPTKTPRGSNWMNLFTHREENESTSQDIATAGNTIGVEEEEEEEEEDNDQEVEQDPEVTRVMNKRKTISNLKKCLNNTAKGSSNEDSGIATSNRGIGIGKASYRSPKDKFDITPKDNENLSESYNNLYNNFNNTNSINVNIVANGVNNGNVSKIPIGTGKKFTMPSSPFFDEHHNSQLSKQTNDGKKMDEMDIENSSIGKMNSFSNWETQSSPLTEVSSETENNNKS
ncbi:hypothetical protein B5S29_g2258 [[Candida] boidinii]|nr:hypothetical protein B5S29_g2258 [[Candida] boidinii]